MKFIIACEVTGVVTEALIKLGHDARSCDILPSEKNIPHIQDDILNHLDGDYDGMIAFPPCTHLTVSGARWFKDKWLEQQLALLFVLKLMNAPIPLIAIENPIGVISTRIRKPDQIIQPWQFGHGETKATCLWLSGFSPLKPTNIVEGRYPRIHKEPPSQNRGAIRSRTYQGIALAMANQWGDKLHEMKARVIPKRRRNFGIMVNEDYLTKEEFEALLKKAAQPLLKLEQGSPRADSTSSE